MAPHPIKFALDQVKKTARRPARIFPIAANMLLQRDHPTAALLCLSPLLKFGRPTTDEYLLGANCLYQGLGRLRDAMALLAQSSQQSLQEVAKLGLTDLPFRVLDNVWVRHIGHLGIMDYVLKLGILEGRRRENTILYLPAGSRIANRFLLDQLTPHLQVLENPADLPFPAPAVQALHHDLFSPRLPDLPPIFYWELADQTYRRWEQERGRPLLSLPREIEARGRAVLERLGMAQGAWFVALHVREREPDGRHSGINGIRNAHMSSYFPAIAEVARRGGWVVRIGDPSMARLPPLANVIDYCHSSARSDWMDIYILACCRFLIGTNSGPAFVPALYGTPALLTNWWPVAERPWHPSDIFIPKLLRSGSDGRYLTLSETLREPLGWCYSRRHLAKHAGVRVDDNDPEIIRAAVEEMLARSDATASPDTDDAGLHQRTDRVYQAQGIAGRSRLPHGFLRRHSDLIA